MLERLKVIGGQESYFTGKLETYLRAKGIAYQNVPFTMETLQEAASHTGFMQIPQVVCADGSWLVDTTLIIDYLDDRYPEPVTSPTDPAARFIALLLEDYADEWMWRPAMHYRWSFESSSDLMSAWLAEHLPDMAISPEEKKAFWLARQRGTFVDGDGVSDETRAAVESSYRHALTALEAIFQHRDYILGDRPTQADFGFMGPMFRHFFCDPEPARIMRETAPAVHEWVARMWNLRPRRFSSAAQIEALPADIGYLLEPVLSAYLPYLAANQAAVIAQQPQVSYHALGVNWTEPAKPYRLWCLDQLRKRYRVLTGASKSSIADLVGSEHLDRLLSTGPTGHCDHLFGALPYGASEAARPVFSSWGSRGDSGDS